MPTPSKIVVALDTQEEATLHALIAALDADRCRVKVGKTLFTRYGPELIKLLHTRGFEVFLDLKFHDIPEQVSGACYEAAQLGVWMLTVHASGGAAMLAAAKRGIEKAVAKGATPPLLVGVTLLTSLKDTDLETIGLSGTMQENVDRLAKLCFAAGLSGIVCSPHEVSALKAQFGPAFLCVTPGIRLPDADKHDQQRTMTPQAAVALGSDYLVVGRNITQAPSPASVLEQMNKSILV